MAEIEYPKVYLYRRLVMAKLFIDNNFSNNIDLENIADEAFFSKFHFVRQFKSIYGKTPHQYLISVRIKKAMELLSAETSVSDTCFAIGFESVGSFSALFKKLVGISPSVYLLKQKENRERMSKEPLKFIPGCHAQHMVGLQKSNFEEAAQ